MMKREEDLESVSMRSIQMRMGSVNASALGSVGNLAAVAASMGSLHGTNSVNINMAATGPQQLHHSRSYMASVGSPCTVPSNTPMSSVNFR